MYPFKVGDFVKHKGNCGPESMFVCAINTRIIEFPIGCRWWNEERREFNLEWFAVEELKLWNK